MTVVFDTNVYISALITEGVCAKILRRARLREFSLSICPFIINEIKQTLSKKFRISKKELSSAIEIIKEAVSNVVYPDMPVPEICEDKDDNHVITCALASGAKYLVTGDAELLGIKRYKKLRILSPRDFELMFD